MREEIQELCTMVTQQKELEERNAIVLGSNALEVLQALTQRVKEGKLKGRVILLQDDDIIPYEVVSKVCRGPLWNNIPNPETEGKAVKKGARALKRLVDQELECVNDDFYLLFLVKGQGGEGQ